MKSEYFNTSGKKKVLSLCRGILNSTTLPQSPQLPFPCDSFQEQRRPPTKRRTYRDALLDEKKKKKNFARTSKLVCTKTADGIARIPLAKCQSKPLDVTQCQRFTPSFLTRSVAVKCGQTSGGISSLGHRLNNSTPCLPYCGALKYTGTHTMTKTSSIFHLLC